MGSTDAPIAELDTPTLEAALAAILSGVAATVASKPEQDGISALTQAENAVQGELDKLLGEAAREIIRQAAGVSDEPQIDPTGLEALDMDTVLALVPADPDPPRAELLTALRETAALLAEPVRAPQGIQRKRTEGFRLPEGAVVVTRARFVAKPDPLECAGKWGNPFVVGATTPDIWPEPWRSIHVRDAQHAVELHAAYIQTRPDFLAKARADLAGHDLACWCKLGDPCHRDTLLAVANS